MDFKFSILDNERIVMSVIESVVDNSIDTNLGQNKWISFSSLSFKWEYRILSIAKFEIFFKDANDPNFILFCLIINFNESNFEIDSKHSRRLVEK